MSVPPVTIQIKRKATDDPVDFLRVHEPHGKRLRRATDFVFSRQPVPEAGSTSAELQPPFPNVRQIKQPHRAAGTHSPAIPATQLSPQLPSQVDAAVGLEASVPDAITQIPSLQNDTKPSENLASYDAVPESQAVKLRRFHMSRSSTPTDPPAPLASGKARKRPAQPAVFVERKSRTGQPKRQKLEADAGPDVAEKSAPIEEHRQQKKPGMASRVPAVSAKSNIVPGPNNLVASNSKPKDLRVPSGLMMPWDVNSEQLAAEMQAYTLQEIGKNIAASEIDNTANKPLISSNHSKPSQSRFKPKKPAMRYHERHPEQAPEKLHNEMDVDDSFSGDEMDDDAEYIIDTYIRIPAHTLESTGNPKNIGLLVLDSQPDIDDFYLEDWDSDEEEEDEEEDENAENHYTADYPDEEVDSDDEYGRNPYLYRTHNASDLEEFDEDDVEFSDEESTKYPWAKHPWTNQSGERAVTAEEDDDE
ncbi:hypothetical protein G7Y89_g6705 [Cudoniella acicularis]|uniref:Transcription factor Iwr1 domain-containing protein n=1 Tax=Cudoniella acicularis TaxID=354080 RepID=A0A8H4RLR6_9HELO|nr:hypothetical protein G7Y89_g6705 [Cudoniella acicularis]